MTDTDFHWVTWLAVLGVGLPTLAFMIWKRWRMAQSGFFWRAVICFIAACITTPIVVSEDFGGIKTVDILPTSAVIPSALFGIVFTADRVSLGEFLEASIASLLSILVVASVLAGIWSAIIRSRRGRLCEAT